ncbi:hypothetical protein F2Q69_00058956 [Brassica cretica]|uniref:Uncharacterized protein n=1 Tax=Brassica cretica TaxID=69181 RepID=A0A8S9RE05_BRACR|nr:hypothetical protein F2Q69_00058956 [Brassica cretica]
MKQEQVCSNPKGENCRDGMKTARSFQLGHPPNWTGPSRRMAELVAWTGPDRRMAELVAWTGPDRRMAELVACSIQHGYPPNWTGSAWRMAKLVFCTSKGLNERVGLRVWFCDPFLSKRFQNDVDSEEGSNFSCSGGSSRSDGDTDRDETRACLIQSRRTELQGWDCDSTIVPARPSAELDWSSSANGGAGRVFDPARPSAKLDWSTLADSRACRVFDPAWQSAELDWFSSANGRVGRVFDPARPSTELDWFSLVDGRAGRVVDPARPSAELDWLSSADGRAGRVVDPARPSAEQVAWSIQLGGWQNRLNQTMGRSSAIANHLICQCSSAPQKVRTNELDCLFGSAIHFSRVFCSGTFVEDFDPNRISEDARILAKRQIFGSRIRVFDTMPRDVRDQCAGFRARPRSNPALGGAMTSSTYVSRIIFDLISSCFKVRDMFSAYVTCMVGIEHLFEDNF